MVKVFMIPCIMTMALLLSTNNIVRSQDVNDSILYIVEVTGSIDDECSSVVTMLSSDFKDSTEVCLHSGYSAKLSPNGSYIAYMYMGNDSDPESPGLLIADSHAKRIGEVPILPNKSKHWWKIANISWSPMGDKLAVLAAIHDSYPNGHATLIIIDFIKKTIRYILETSNLPAKEVYFHSIEWLPDGKQLLYYKLDELLIVDTQSEKSIQIAKEKLLTHIVTKDGKRIIYVPFTSDGKAGHVLEYEIPTQKTKALLSLDFGTRFDMPEIGACKPAAIFEDGKSILYTKFSKEHELMQIDVQNQKLTTVDTEVRHLTFIVPSSAEADAFFVLKDKDYGIFDLKTRQYRHLKKADKRVPAGEAGMAFCLFFWMDWVKRDGTRNDLSIDSALLKTLK